MILFEQLRGFRIDQITFGDGEILQASLESLFGKHRSDIYGKRMEILG